MSGFQNYHPRVYESHISVGVQQWFILNTRLSSVIIFTLISFVFQLGGHLSSGCLLVIAFMKMKNFHYPRKSFDKLFPMKFSRSNRSYRKTSHLHIFYLLSLREIFLWTQALKCLLKWKLNNDTQICLLNFM